MQTWEYQDCIGSRYCGLYSKEYQLFFAVLERWVLIPEAWKSICRLIVLHLQATVDSYVCFLKQQNWFKFEFETCQLMETFCVLGRRHISHTVESQNTVALLQSLYKLVECYKYSHLTQRINTKLRVQSASAVETFSLKTSEKTTSLSFSLLHVWQRLLEQPSTEVGQTWIYYTGN